MPKFMQLWENHPTIKGDGPLLDRSVYENQCAINLSAALMRSGVDMSKYPGVKSWQKDKPKFAIRAEELANWLASGGGQISSKLTKHPGSTAFDNIEDKTGIIFMKDYYGPGNSGDHIDLFNGSRLTARTSWFRIQWGLSWEGYWSDFTKAKEIWFWQMH